MSDEVETNILHLGQPSGDGKKGMSDIADKIYAATGLTLGAEAAAKVGHMIRLARQAAREEAALVIANKTVPETPVSFEDVLDRDLEMMATIRALGEKE